MQPRYLFLYEDGSRPFVIRCEPTRDDILKTEVGVTIVRLGDRSVYDGAGWASAPDLELPSLDAVADGILVTPEDDDFGPHHVHPGAR